jgi:hypothetical protein
MKQDELVSSKNPTNTPENMNIPLNMDMEVVGFLLLLFLSRIFFNVVYFIKSAAYHS